MLVGAGSGWVRDVAPTAMQLVFQNLLQEQDAGALEASQQLWRVLLERVAGGATSTLLPDALLKVCSGRACHLGCSGQRLRQGAPPREQYVCALAQALSHI